LGSFQSFDHSSRNFGNSFKAGFCQCNRTRTFFLCPDEASKFCIVKSIFCPFYFHQYFLTGPDKDLRGPLAVCLLGPPDEHESKKKRCAGEIFGKNGAVAKFLCNYNSENVPKTWKFWTPLVTGPREAARSALRLIRACFLSFKTHYKNFSDLKTRLFWLCFHAVLFENNASILGLESGLNLAIFSFIQCYQNIALSHFCIQVNLFFSFWEYLLENMLCKVNLRKCRTRPKRRIDQKLCLLKIFGICLLKFSLSRYFDMYLSD
jgi:hypothetical protein